MASAAKKAKELKRRYGALVQSLNSYCDHLKFRLMDFVDDDVFAYVMANVKGVDMLDLDETDITNQSVALLSTLEYVKELRLKSCAYVDDDCIPWLGNIQQLVLLHVKGTQITIDGLLQLPTMPGLQTLLFSAHGADDNLAKVQRLAVQQPGCELIMDGKVMNG